MKTVRVRFPSDDEWITRQRRRKVLVKQLGRGISETTVANGEDVDAALVTKIREGEEPEIDPFEAMKLVEQLSLAEVDDVLPDGDSFKVTLRVLGATTVHLLKMPSAKDVFEYRRGFARLLDMPHRLAGPIAVMTDEADVWRAIDDEVRTLTQLQHCRSEIGDFRLHGTIERGKRFIQNQQLWLKRQSPRDRQPLSLPTAELGGGLKGLLLRNAHLSKKHSRPVFSFPLA